MIWWIIAFVLLGLLTFIVAAPISLEIDSVRRKYRIAIGGILSLHVVIVESQLILRLRVFGLPIDIEPSMPKRKPAVAKTGAPKQKKRLHLSPSDVLRKARQFPAAFDLTRFELDLDTGDFALNAILFPIAYRLSDGARRVQINFQGTSTLRMRLVTTSSRLAAALLT